MWTNRLSDLSGLTTLALSGLTGSSTATATTIGTQALLEPLQLAVSSSRASNLPDAIKQLQGTVSFNSGTIVSNITSPSRNLQNTVTVANLASDLTTSLQQLTGTLDFANGSVTSNLRTPTGRLQGTFAFAESAGNYANAIVDQINATVPFQNGQFTLDLPTSLGTIAGTLNFANGQLASNLTTPYGPITGTFDFPDNAQFSFTSGDIAGVVDLAQGQVTTDLLPGVPGGEIAIPLSSLSGTAILGNGEATIEIPTAFGAISTNFDLSQLIDDFVTESLQLTGRLTFNNGIVASNLTGPLGSLAGTYNLVDTVNEAATFLNQVQGNVSISNGLLTSNLTTPSGPIQGNLDLTDLADAFNFTVPARPQPQPTLSATVNSGNSTNLGVSDINLDSLISDLAPLIGNDSPFVLGPTLLGTLVEDPALRSRLEAALSELDPNTVLTDPFSLIEALV